QMNDRDARVIMAQQQTTLVAAAVLVERGRVLVTQRKTGAHLAGMWEFPGGKVEPGEDPRAALVREMREELGMDVSIGEIVDVTFHESVDAKRAGPLSFSGAARLEGPPGPRALAVAAFKWGTREDLDPRLFPPADVPVLAKIAARLGE